MLCLYLKLVLPFVSRCDSHHCLQSEDSYLVPLYKTLHTLRHGSGL